MNLKLGLGDHREDGNDNLANLKSGLSRQGISYQLLTPSTRDYAGELYALGFETATIADYLRARAELEVNSMLNAATRNKRSVGFNSDV